MTNAPYPADTRARGWRFEIDMEKVEASDTWLRARSGAVKGALLLLWSKAWQQTPCGSLPDDDELIALLIDMPTAIFAKHRNTLRRGWSRADDGRLYHEVITTRVLAMLEKRAKDAVRAAGRRGRAAESVATPPVVAPESRVTHAGVAPEFDTKHQAPSTREEKHPPTPRKRGSVEGFPPGFERFWESYPRKVGKDAAGRAYAKRRFTPEQQDAVLDALDRQRTSEQWTKDGGQFIPHPSTWLNEGRWQDETETTRDRYAGSEI